MESFATIVHGLYLLIIDTKLSILGVCGSPVCVSIQCKKTQVEKGKWTIFCVMFFFSLLKWQYFDDDDDDDDDDAYVIQLLYDIANDIYNIYDHLVLPILRSVLRSTKNSRCFFVKS